MRTRYRDLSLLLIWILAGQAASAAPKHFESGTAQVSLVELFSSEGCSSCPPADRWMGQLRGNPDLWKRFVPVEYHVDYWNYLGWADPLAQPAFSSRQQNYAAQWGTPSVYTPGLVLRGREWRPWGDVAELRATRSQAGELRVEAGDGGRFEARYRPVGTGSSDGKARRWILHGALLGNGLSTQVTRGENSGRKLAHEFTALAFAEAPLAPLGAAGLSAVLRFEQRKAGQPRPGSYSVAFWVTEEGSPDVLQATGGDLD